MIYRLTEEEQKQVNELYQKFINTPKENEALKDKIDNEFIALMDSIEIKRFNENIKDTERLIKNAEDLINDAILYEYVFLALPWLIDPDVPIPKERKGDMKPVYLIDESFIEEHKHVDVWFYYHDLIEKLAKEPPQEPLLLFDRENIKQYLESKIIAKHIAYLKGSEHEEKLNNIIDECLNNSDFVFNENGSSQNPPAPVQKACITYKKREFILDPNYWVIMKNDLIESCVNSLSAIELKLLRLAITQCQREDTELYEYAITAQKFTDYFGLNNKYFYTHAKEMMRNITAAYIELENGTQNWVDRCFYKDGVIYIKLAEGLKPYITQLKACYSEIQISEYAALRSKHAIIIRELIQAKMAGVKPYASVATQISISVEELQRVTNTTSKYDKISSFRKYVLEPAIKEINDYEYGYHITITPYRDGKKIDGFYFTIESQTGYNKRIGDSEYTDTVPKKVRVKKTSKRNPKEYGEQLTLDI